MAGSGASLRPQIRSHFRWRRTMRHVSKCSRPERTFRLVFKFLFWFHFLTPSEAPWQLQEWPHTKRSWGNTGQRGEESSKLKTCWSLLKRTEQHSPFPQGPVGLTLLLQNPGFILWLQLCCKPSEAMRLTFYSRDWEWLHLDGIYGSQWRGWSRSMWRGNQSENLSLWPHRDGFSSRGLTKPDRALFQ